MRREASYRVLPGERREVYTVIRHQDSHERCAEDRRKKVAIVARDKYVSRTHHFSWMTSPGVVEVSAGLSSS